MDNGCPGTRSLFNRFYGTNVRRKEDPKGLLVAVAQEMDTKTKTLSARCEKVTWFCKLLLAWIYENDVMSCVPRQTYSRVPYSRPFLLKIVIQAEIKSVFRAQ